jgi:hypothetical protein
MARRAFATSVSRYCLIFPCGRSENHNSTLAAGSAPISRLMQASVSSVTPETEWVVRVTAPDVDDGLREGLPERDVQDSAIDHEEILIERRTTHSVHRQRRSADQGMVDAMFQEKCCDAIEKRHG